MPLSLKHLILILLIFHIISASANSHIDTTWHKKQIEATFTSSVNHSIYLRGVEAIRNDSLDKGIHIIALGCQPYFSHPKYLYLLNYEDIEMMELIRLMDSGKLSNTEMNEGRLLFKPFFTNKIKSNLKDLDHEFINNPNSAFILRVRLLAYKKAGDDRANDIATALLKIDPQLLTINMFKAQYYLDNGNYAESLNWCTKLIQMYPEYTYAWYLKGKDYEFLHKKNMAIDYFNKVLNLFPLHLEASYDRSDVLLDSGKYREAIAGFIWALKANPSYGYPAYKLSSCYKELYMRDSALYYINIHIIKYPDDADGYDLKGEIFNDNRDKISKITAIRLFNRAIKLNPENEGYYEDRGAAYSDIDSLNLSIKDFTKAISIDKNRVYPEIRLGYCYYRKNEYISALTHYKQALRIDSTYKYAYTDIDLIYSKQGKHKECIELLKKALVIDSTYNFAIGNLGWEYYCVGNYDACIKYSYKLLSIEPSASYAMYNIALATLCKGDFEKAKERYTYYYNLCKQKRYDMHISGATDDLRNLIKTNRFKEQSADIIQNVFGETP
ncbi:tetratricopeptide repeat protein [Mucilaginibacter sp. L196]|uniref:tetratricopeptide repeat protein n=1 Tax=Mucilaginibacter sp. L196 TaxID=1641870 RepID=UPI00131EB450|nr:tetratricopeptide repeat protein [Mucilaginibacter sp. L196]